MDDFMIHTAFAMEMQNVIVWSKIHMNLFFFEAITQT